MKRTGIPDKLYFKIGEVSAIADVPAYVLRFWETEFKRLNPKRTDTGQRLYRKQDVKMVLHIKHLLYEKKFTIEGAKKHLLRHLPARRTGLSKAVLKEIRSELESIRRMLTD